MSSLLPNAVAAVARRIVGDAGGICDRATVRRDTLDALRGGPLDLGDLGEMLDDELESRLGALEALPGGKVADLGALGERLVLTHRLAEHEIEGERLDLDPDLAPLARLAVLDGGLHTPAGARLRLREQRVRGASRAGGILYTTHLAGPQGWLGGLHPGRLVAARVAGGFLELAPVAEGDLGPPPEGLAGGVDALLDVLNEGDGSPVWVEEVVWAIAAAHPDWLARPRPPLGEMIAAAGLEVDGRSVGRPGVWEEHERIGRIVATVARHDLEVADHEVLRDGLAAFDAWASAPAGTAHPGPSLRRRLRDRWPAALALLEELRWRGETGDRIAGFGQALGGAGSEPGAVGLWLQSRGAAIAGRPLDAERLAGDALAADGAFPPAIDEAAWYAGDRGRARDAANLLHRVVEHDDAQLEMLRHYARLGAPGVGRNEPCPCGSGRKFKQCHLGRQELPERDRVRWLLDKAREYVTRTAPLELLEDLEREAGPGDGHDLIALDLLLFHGGWWSRFLDGRGALLGAWERATGDAWVEGGVTSVFRVDRVDGAGHRHLRDAATGQVLVAEPSPALGGAGPDRVVWCRLLPVGDRWYASGVARMTWLHERDGILAALRPPVDLEALTGALCGSDDGPVLQNTSGDPLVTCRATWHPTAVAGADDVAGRLDRAFEREADADGPVWHLVGDTGGMAAAVLATVRLDGEAVITEANSLARHDRLAGLLRDALGGLAVVSESREPLARHQARRDEDELARAATGILGAGPPEPAGPDGDDGALADDAADDAEVQRLLDEYRAEQEERWLDQPVPALGGRTPRAAAADDALRPDLLTLLAESDDRGAPGNDRIRAALELPR